MKPKYFFWIIFVITFYWIFQIYKPFLMNFIVALLLCISTFGLKKIVDKHIKYNLLSSFITLILFVMCFVLPIVVVSIEAINEISRIDTSKLSHFIHESQDNIIILLEKLPSSLKDLMIDSIKSINTNTLISHAMGISKMIGAAGVKFITDFVFILIFLYLFYYYGTFLRDYIIDIIPFDKKNSNEILGEVSGVIRVVFFTTIISMVLQGFSFGIVISFFGFSGILFGIFYGLASIVPIVGGAIVWLPVCLYIYWTGDLKCAIAIALYSMIFIGFIIDNVIKPILIGIVNKLLLEKPVKINEMIIFIAILAGLTSVGFWGIIIGPTISAFFIALLRMYKNKFKTGELHC